MHEIQIDVPDINHEDLTIAANRNHKDQTTSSDKKHDRQPLALYEKKVEAI